MSAMRSWPSATIGYPPTSGPSGWSTSPSGEKVSILISRRDRLQRLDATFGQEPVRQWGLEANPDATAAQKAHRKAWIGE